MDSSIPSLAALSFSSLLILLVILSPLSSSSAMAIHVHPTKPYTQITVMGMVYCDACSNGSFSTHSYFLPGALVRIDCMFRAMSTGTTEEISFSANRTTNKYGVYKLEIPAVDGIVCARDKAFENSCSATLISTSSSSCNVPSDSTTSDEIAFKSARPNLCIYNLNPLNFKPSKINTTLCGN